MSFHSQPRRLSQFPTQFPHYGFRFTPQHQHPPPPPPPPPPPLGLPPIPHHTQQMPYTPPFPPHLPPPFPFVPPPMPIPRNVLDNNALLSGALHENTGNVLRPVDAPCAPGVVDAPCAPTAVDAPCAPANSRPVRRRRPPKRSRASSRSDIPPHGQGLLNTTNTLCWLNSMIQLLSTLKFPKPVLATTLGVASTLLNLRRGSQRLSHPRIEDDDISVLWAMREFAKTLMVGTYPSTTRGRRLWDTRPLCNALLFLRSFRRHNFSIDRQQDVQDALTCLVAFIETNTLVRQHFSPLRNFLLQNVGVVCKWQTTRPCHHSTVSQPLHSQIIALNFPRDRNNSTISVQRMLNGYLQRESIPRVRCTTCNVEHAMSSRTNKVTEAQDFLFISCKRFERNARGTTTKIRNRVRANTFLTIPVCPVNHLGFPQGATDVRYRLVAQCFHNGSSTSSGHYWTECKRNGQWLTCNDAQITNRTAQGFSSTTRTSYIYLYKKIPETEYVNLRRRLNQNDDNARVAYRSRNVSLSSQSSNDSTDSDDAAVSQNQSSIDSKFDNKFVEQEQRSFNNVDLETYLREFNSAKHGALHKQKEIQKLCASFDKKQSKYAHRRCSRCHIGWFTNELLKVAKDEWKCRGCRYNKNKANLFSKDNNTIPGQPPEWAQGLTEMEEMIISPILPFMHVHQLKGGQLGMKGNVIQFRQNVLNLAKTVPRLPNEINFLMIKPRGKNHKHNTEVKRRYKVRRDVIQKFLENAIKTKHPAYLNVTYDPLRLQSWPENDIPDVGTTIEEGKQHSKKATTKDKDGDIEMKDASKTAVPSGFDDGFDFHDDDSIEDEDAAPYECVLNEPRNIIRESDAIDRIVNQRELTQPDRSDNPINEFEEEYLLAKCFPTLFANEGNGDPFAPGLRRQVAVDQLDSFKYLLKTCYYKTVAKDISKPLSDSNKIKTLYAPFAEHARFKFWVHSYYKRHQSLNQAKMFMKQNPKELEMTLEELQKALRSKNAKTPAFLRKLQRYSAQVRGSSSFWYRELQKLRALCKEDDCGTFFFTTSYADYNCPHLHRILGTENASKKEKRAAVKNNPHIVAGYRIQRMRDWVNIVLKKALGCDWTWRRTEFQARGTGHDHGMAHMLSDPNLRKLCMIGYEGHVAATRLEKQNSNLSKDDLKVLREKVRVGKDAEHRVITFVDTLVQTMNPIKQPVKENWAFPAKDNHPCEKSFTSAQESKNEMQEYADLLNVCERHTKCGPCCLRKKKKDKEWKCRFHFPYQMRDKTEITYEPRKNNPEPKVTIATKRNDPLVNHHNRVLFETWRSNIDIQAIVDYQACINYLAKYAAKCEKKSDRINATLETMSKKLTTSSSIHSLYRKLMISCSADRDISAQEACHEILGLSLVSHPEHRFEDVNLRATRGIQVRGNRARVFPNKVDIYADRAKHGFDDLVNVNLDTFVRTYNIRNLTKDEPTINIDTNQKSKKILNYFPNISAKRDGKKFSEFCKLELLKYKPWSGNRSNAWNNLEDANEIIAFYDEFMTSKESEEFVPEPVRLAAQRASLDPEEEGDAMQEDGHAEADIPDWMAASRALGASDGIEEEEEFSVDESVDWSADCRKYSAAELERMGTWISDMKKEHGDSFRRSVAEVSISNLNTKQQKVYDKVVNHWTKWKNKEVQDNLKITVLGTAGTGKSYLINSLKQTLKDNCILLAPTGVAADNIAGSTQHPQATNKKSKTQRSRSCCVAKFTRKG